MKQRQVLALMAGVTMALAACGSGNTGTGANKGTIKIGIDLPISGNDASDGVPAENGALFAIKQANDAGGIDGYTLAASPLDDASATLGKHDPQQGANNVKQFIADTKVLAMVGPFNSNVARAEMPLASTADLPVISPSNTGECLTQTFSYCTNGEPQSLHPGGKTNYFRVCTTDNIQGPALADFAIKSGYKTVYILDDSETYGKGLADNFDKEFKAKGGTVAGHDEFDANSTHDFKSFLNKAKSKSVDLVMFGGTTSNSGGIIRLQMKDILPGVPYFAGDGISDAQFLKDAGSNADGSVYSVAAVNADTLPSAKTFLADFKKAYTKDTDYGAYTANMYDATKILIAAIDRAIKANNGNVPTREQVRVEITKTDYNGVIGHTTFDANGDTSNKIISFYKVTGGKAVFSDQITFSG
ncbi:MAG TPA: branched-chain amino acid ABC transporter substrate-binding protein [Candidatus Dormibacteraeota bacterium]|jgi:branched-chain amino acid transport system substrate-binding protein|nr:branched-chain amino acid ABC transporter substrate-binding protein [Candidatus Dormibacteraeota bacterium]